MDDKQRIALVRFGAAHPDDRGPAVQFQLGDHLGSSNVVVDSAGALVNREELTPYGATSFGSFSRKRYRFTGKERDEESGLNYHSARYYAPWAAKWLSADPLGAAAGINIYVYAGSSPLNFVDGSGMEQMTPEQITNTISGLMDVNNDKKISTEEYLINNLTPLELQFWENHVEAHGAGGYQLEGTVNNLITKRHNFIPSQTSMSVPGRIMSPSEERWFIELIRGRRETISFATVNYRAGVR